MQELEKMFDEMIEQQRSKLVEVAGEIVPHLTDDDLLQPNDFPVLENHPHFRYEEGLLAGLLAAQMAFRALARELEEKTVVF